jgi:hypothetical protein
MTIGTSEIGHLYSQVFYETEFMISSLVILDPLVTQPMMQRRPNPTELRSMDSYIQIFCRFQKYKQNFPPLLRNEKSTLTTPNEDFSHRLGG